MNMCCVQKENIADRQDTTIAGMPATASMPAQTRTTEKAKDNDSNSFDVSPAKVTMSKTAGISTAVISTAAAGGVLIKIIG